MVASDMLFQLIQHLQHSPSVAHGRRALLDYIRKTSGARLGLLFLLDEESQALKLLEQSGRRPHHFFPAHSENDINAYQIGKEPFQAGSSKKQFENTLIPLHGLFGSVLQVHGLLHVPDLYNDPQGLEEEKYWAWHDGSVILSSVNTGQRWSNEQGVLVLCFGPKENMATLEEGNLLLCISLLTAYLSKSGRETGLGTLLTLQIPEREAQGAEQAGEAAYLFQRNVLDQIIQLFEIGLLETRNQEAHELYRQLLAQLCYIAEARSGCFWLYDEFQKRFEFSATQGDDALITRIEPAELQRLIEQQPAIPDIQFIQTEVVLLPIHYQGVLMGVMVLLLDGEAVHSEKLRSLLPSLGKMVALILRNFELHRAVQETLIDQERRRIARDLHDGMAQDIAHVLHKLEFIRRVLEKQPQDALHEASRAQSILEGSLNDVRHGIATLLSVQLEKQGFQTMMQSLLDEFSQNEPDIDIHYDIFHLDLLPSSLEAPIYRFIQEALNNVQKHARASEVTISMRTFGGRLVVQVSDNGVGFIPDKNKGVHAYTSKIGLRAMQERIEQAGGTLEIRSIADEGTTLKARFPLAAPSSVLTNREREVLRLLVEGSTNRAIAEKLSVSIETVKSHVHHIMQKMHARDRTQAAVLATKQRWL